MLAHPRVVIHLESGDEVVIFEGEVETIEVTEEIAGAFHEKYDWRPDPSPTSRPLIPREAGDRPRLARARLSEERDAVRLLRAAAG